MICTNPFALTGVNAAPPRLPAPDLRNELARDLARLAEILPILAAQVPTALAAATPSASVRAVRHLRAAALEAERCATHLKIALPPAGIPRTTAQVTDTQEQTR